ncbi:hypothetical protein B6U93_04425 [Candidatus Woesearchaeota archaeon ex4484_78]|nr:MAG: hypothetical protein B6U93_04425 [Candidatus Woesearchaeota archaeon ex4484_78]
MSLPDTLSKELKEPESKNKSLRLILYSREPIDVVYELIENSLPGMNLSKGEERAFYKDGMLRQETGLHELLGDENNHKVFEVRENILKEYHDGHRISEVYIHPMEQHSGLIEKLNINSLLKGIKEEWDKESLYLLIHYGSDFKGGAYDEGLYSKSVFENLFATNEIEEIINIVKDYLSVLGSDNNKLVASETFIPEKPELDIDFYDKEDDIAYKAFIVPKSFAGIIFFVTRIIRFNEQQNKS